MAKSARHKRHHEEPENHERWLVSYADFITLLFAFFVVLYATSSQNTEKEKKFEETIREEFKMAAGNGPGNGSSGQANNPAPNVGQAPQAKGLGFDPSEFFNRPRSSNKDLENHIESLIDKSFSTEEKKAAINDINHDAMGVRISLAAATFFPIGSAKLRLPALKALDKVAVILKKSNRKLMIEGHTDDIQIAGGQFESNWELASLRATTVVRYLIKVHQIPADRLAAISYGDQKPVAKNDNEENRSKNRRIEILVVNNDIL